MMHHTRTLGIALLLGLTLFVPLLSGAGTVTVKGRVRDRSTKAPLPLAFVMVEGRSDGVSVSAEGEFEIGDVDPSSDTTLIVYCNGYQIARVPAVPGVIAMVEMERDFTVHEEITVYAESGVDNEGTQASVIKKMDVYTIPGTAADPLLTATVLPGVTTSADTSGLMIRGGAPDEIGYYYNGIEILHPFQTETSKAAYFSIFDNQMLKKFDVMNAGYSPKFGHSLSGVLEMRSLEEAVKREGGFGVSMVGLSAIGQLPIRPKLGMILSAKKDFSDVLSWIYDTRGADFDNTNMMGMLYFKPNDVSRLEFGWIYNNYEIDQGMTFRATPRNKVLMLSYSTVWKDRLHATAAAAYSNYVSPFEVPAEGFGKSLSDRALQFRTDQELFLGRHTIGFGFDFLKRSERVTVNVSNDAATFDADGDRYGAYMTDEFRFGGRWLASIGARAGLLRIAGGQTSTWDPRASIAYILGDHTTLRASFGIYSQFADLFEVQDGAFKPKKADQASISWDFVTEKDSLRLSVYNKRYRNLVVSTADEPDQASQLSNAGTGFARGFEVFYKRHLSNFDLMFVYNYLDSERREGQILKRTTSSYEIPHSLTAVASYKRENFQVALRCGFETGLPYTPLTSVIRDDTTGLYTPIYGAPNSARLPDFLRFDLAGNRLWPRNGRVYVLYLAAINLFDRNNIQRLDFNRNKGRMDPQSSIFRRSIVAGLYITF